MKEHYDREGYVIVKKFLPIQFVTYLREYFNTLKISGKLESGDPQVQKSHCIYGDPAFDTLMLMSAPMISNIIGKTLLPTYTYARIYERGAELLPHLDRAECEHSMTLSLGGEYDSLWPIWLMKKDVHTTPIRADLEPGDIVVYKGTEVVHWRDAFEGKLQYQVFIHYVEKSGSYENQIYDKRPYIGMPASSKQ